MTPSVKLVNLKMNLLKLKPLHFSGICALFSSLLIMGTISKTSAQTAPVKQPVKPHTLILAETPEKKAALNQKDTLTHPKNKKPKSKTIPLRKPGSTMILRRY